MRILFALALAAAGLIGYSYGQTARSAPAFSVSQILQLEGRKADLEVQHGETATPVADIREKIGQMQLTLTVQQQLLKNKFQSVASVQDKNTRLTLLALIDEIERIKHELKTTR